MMTNHYESATVPGIFFAGTIGQGVAGLRKYGHPANSGAVHGARYNLRLMIETLARAAPGRAPATAGVGPRGPRRATSSRSSPRPPSCGTRSRTWRAPCPATRTARCATRASCRWRDYVDSAGPDGVAVTVETDAEGDIHPAIYVRRHGRVDGDATLDGAPLHDYRTPAHRAQLPLARRHLLPDRGRGRGPRPPRHGGAVTRPAGPPRTAADAAIVEPRWSSASPAPRATATPSMPRCSRRAATRSRPTRRPPRRFAQRIATGGARPGRYVQAGDLGAMGLIHELFHVAIAAERRRQAAGAGR